MSSHHWLAQINIARMRAPIDDPLMADFVAQLAEVNALAEKSPGFVWRLQGDGGDSTSIRAFEDPLILVNMSVWETLEALQSYVYRGRHGQVDPRSQEVVSQDGRAVLRAVVDRARAHSH